MSISMNTERFEAGRTFNFSSDATSARTAISGNSSRSVSDQIKVQRSSSHRWSAGQQGKSDLEVSLSQSCGFDGNAGS
jgi:hypothetical protein